MSNYAYLDKDRTQIIYANSNNIMNYKSVKCYCPNPNCNADMYIVRPEHPNKAHFSANGKNKHTGNCGYASSHFNRMDYDETLFRFPEILQHLEYGQNKNNHINKHMKLNNSNDKISKPLTTIKQIYTMCKNTPIYDTYNSFYINDILADERNYSNYLNGIEGYKMAECTYYSFDNATQSMLLNFTKFRYSEEPRYYLKIYFNNRTLYYQMKSRIIPTSHNTGILVISGNWEKAHIYVKDDKYIEAICYINSEKQIAVIRKD